MPRDNFTCKLRLLSEGVVSKRKEKTAKKVEIPI